MKDTEIRIAIAEACGITGIDAQEWTAFVDGDVVDVPDYPNDLNAMHEAEKVFDDGVKDAGSMRWRYADQLYRVTVPNDTQPCRATARQRAEAFLRTIGKWKETDSQ